MTPARIRTRRPLGVAAAGLAGVVAVTALAGCSRSGQGTGASGALSAVSQRYEASVDPAHSALTATVSRALAYDGGPTASLDASVPPTVSALRRASGQLGAIAAPPPIRRDILDVAKAMDAVVADLNAMAAARGADVQPAIALVVADSGRESATDNLVRLALAQPTTAASVTPAIPVIAVTTTIPDTTTSATTLPTRATTTTRPAATTTTTGARTTTTRAATTTTTLKTL